MKPLMQWDDLYGDHSNLVWQSRLDKRYHIEVQRIVGETHRGIFIIWDKDDNYKQIFVEDVPLAYGAQFGPDMGDVETWQYKGCEVVDGLNGKL